MTRLSRRGRRLIDSSPVPEYIAEHFSRVARPWDPKSAPDGYIGLCIAENKRSNGALMACLDRYDVPARTLGYDAMTGNLAFRERLATFLGRRVFGRSFDADQLVVLAGAGSVLEMLCYALCDAGDAVLIPTPSYAGFWPDLETRDELAIVTADCSSDDGFRLTTAHLDAAIAKADRPVTACLFTTPNNPLGQVCTRDEVLAVVEWAERRGVHLIVDEIYALSVFGEQAFASAASVRRILGDNVHLVWAFSKDFGASGLRCGVLVSENRDVIDAVGSLAYWAACSGHTQHLLSELIADTPIVDAYLADMQAELRGAYARVTTGLRALDVGFVPADAAFFLICDLRPFLDAPTFDAEHRLWRRLLDDANVNLTPGAACRIREPGFFRLCYAATNADAVDTALGRMGRVLTRT